jgi:hypothetical protein
MHALLVLKLSGDAIEFYLPVVPASCPKKAATTLEARAFQVEHVLSKGSSPERVEGVKTEEARPAILGRGI